MASFQVGELVRLDRRRCGDRGIYRVLRVFPTMGDLEAQLVGYQDEDGVELYPALHAWPVCYPSGWFVKFKSSGLRDFVNILT